MINPISTYRIQFNKDFTFKDFKSVISYLHQLGVKTIYASPIYKAVPGSNHGYDVTDPNQINPEIGTLNELREISDILKSLDMYWLQDIVPNHMGFHQDNVWLMDVLKNGEQSPFRQHFDLITNDLKADPLMVPFLGSDLEETIQRGELELVTSENGNYLRYFDNLWPINDQNPKDLEISELAKHQYYRLCSHKETNSAINYRRFFTVNSLICLNIQLTNVFNDYHCLTKQLLDEGVFQGLRIDHIDGLADPKAYLNALRQLCGEDVYIVVEKILEPNEQLPSDWPIQGSTGYDYLGLTNQLFTCIGAKKEFERTYETFVGKQNSVEEQILEKKRTFLSQYMQGELSNLCQLTASLLDKNSQVDASLLKELITEILVQLPVYRLYSAHEMPSKQQPEILEKMLKMLDKENKFYPIWPAFEELLLNKEAQTPNRISFFNRLMQFTGPLMAKGVEDTLMYTYHRFIGNNEVGDSPVHFGMDISSFNRQIEFRASQWPLALNATATHDTKRAEDSRARLLGLTEFASQWTENIAQWRTINQHLKTEQMPDENDEYFIYQTLLASCPENGPSDEDYQNRVLDFIEKALRESKRRSNWDEPNLAYEKATKDFLLQLLNVEGNFWNSFTPFLEKMIKVGKLNSLSSLILKHTLPGIPDTYQGTEFWDLSMVDPDNRRAVDYQARQKSLSALPNTGLADDFHQEPISDQTKLQLTHQLLQLRLAIPDVFAKGNFLPLEVSGNEETQILAFARHYEQQWLIIVVPVINCNKSNSEEAFEQIQWNKIELTLPDQLAQPNLIVKNVLKPTKKVALKSEADAGQKITLDQLFDGHPFAVYHFAISEKKRSAGILMHLTSLSTPFGIGDLGPSAHRFISFLENAGMKYWQVLPLNPISADQSFSPYSSTSSMAGNILLISPDRLIDLKLLEEKDLAQYQLGKSTKVNYEDALKIKISLLKKAYQNWSNQAPPRDFDAFCSAQSNWLEDYALFVLISKLEQGKAWYQWPIALKKRDSEALRKLTKKYPNELQEIKWQQFVFFEQWRELKQRANQSGIQIIGDLPFYCAHNSADVWANPDLFTVDKEGEATAIAGVPPDYFNADGQLWGMPVYNWETMAERQFDWWQERMAINLSLYDKIRLDHFRAFDEYWEVPAASETAKNGSWKPGPKKVFFDTLAQQLGEMNLIAEDLGEITESVYQLRDALNLPGMKVLQFAFGNDMPSSVHIPHQYQNANCIVYTGTHDNNTTRGWYEEDIDKATELRLKRYLGTKVDAKNIAEHLIRLALSSTAEIAVIPIQDFLNEPALARINTPASVEGNWTWSLTDDKFYNVLAIDIADLLYLYNR